MAILQFDEVHRALPVSKGIILKSGKLNEQSNMFILPTDFPLRSHEQFSEFIPGTVV
jgi:hypothetical protein